MNERYAEKVRRLTEAVLVGSGETKATLRQEVEARAAVLGGGLRKSRGEMPPDLRSYVEKVARRAHEVGDQEIEELKQAGWSEDAIYEITVSAALGAGLGRLERGLAALEGEG